MAGKTKDQRLIEANPGKSPYELLQMDLSQDAYDKLILDEESAGQQGEKREPAELQKPAEPVVKVMEDSSLRAQPQLSDYQPVQYGGGREMAVLVDSQGKRTSMTRTAALNWAQRFPQRYTVE